MTPAQRYCFLQTEIHSSHAMPEEDALDCYVLAADYDRLLCEKDEVAYAAAVGISDVLEKLLAAICEKARALRQ